jgi:hypothetical protein
MTVSWFNVFMRFVKAAKEFVKIVSNPIANAADGFSKLSLWYTTYMHMLIPFLMVITDP